MKYKVDFTQDAIDDIKNLNVKNHQPIKNFCVYYPNLRNTLQQAQASLNRYAKTNKELGRAALRNATDLFMKSMAIKFIY